MEKRQIVIENRLHEGNVGSQDPDLYFCGLYIVITYSIQTVSLIE